MGKRTAGLATDTQGDGSDLPTVAPGSKAVAMGSNAVDTGSNAVASGAGSSAQGAGCVAIGGNANRAGRVALSNHMMASVAQFARTGNPGWPAYDLGTRQTMIFDTDSRVESDPRRWERELFARVPYIQPGS